ncbi:SlyX family protein [Lentisphaerota bacterium WC36G]|nr:SlyX family protein [Lentisphaerae bacterium WC36]
MTDKEKLIEAEGRIVELETMITYQEELLGQLNDVMYKQQKDIDILKDKVESIMSQLADSIQPIGKEPPPPHY